MANMLSTTVPAHSQSTTEAQSTLRRSSRAPMPIKHADSTEVEPPKHAKRTILPKSPKHPQGPLKRILDNNHVRSTILPSTQPQKQLSKKVIVRGKFQIIEKPSSHEGLLTPLLSPEETPAAAVSKKRKRAAAPQNKEKAAAKRAKRSPRAPKEKPEFPPQPHVETVPIDLTVANPARGFDLLLLGGEILAQQENKEEVLAETEIMQAFLHKRIANVRRAEVEDRKNIDKQLGKLQWNLSIVESGRRMCQTGVHPLDGYKGEMIVR